MYSSYKRAQINICRLRECNIMNMHLYKYYRDEYEIWLKLWRIRDTFLYLMALLDRQHFTSHSMITASIEYERVRDILNFLKDFS